MNVTEITMSKEEAMAKVNAYRNGIRRRADAEYRVALTAYEELAAGKTLINIDEVFATAELNELGLPNIAIARADRTEIRCHRPARIKECIFSSAAEALGNSTWNWDPNRYPELNIRANLSEQNGIDTVKGFALLPMVPPEVRPKGHLRDYFILWEVDHWSKEPQSRIAPYDPILLKHLTGPLYVVMGSWDLTEVERCIVVGRVSA